MGCSDPTWQTADTCRVQSSHSDKQLYPGQPLEAENIPKYEFIEMLDIAYNIWMYSLVPKERHVRKESNGSTLGLCVVPKESHDSTL